MKDGSMKPDLVYLKKGLFTAFIPESRAGENAWREIAEQTDGTGEVFTVQLPAILLKLRKAGYTVRLAVKTSKEEVEKDINSILKELERGIA